ncbi:MAG: glutamine amidotransferase [Lachnospiraceae bacterium]|nr:glutamine amidotransferase [Lachnospiraceae bacterium]
MKLKICHLYPDALNLYGDIGNIICMSKRLEWRGIDREIVSVKIGDRADLSDCDIVFVGGGQDLEQELLLKDLASGNGAEIKAAVEDGKTFLCICGGYQMLGNYYMTGTGEKMDFLGAVDLYTVGDVKRMIGNYAFQVDLPDGRKTEVVGFENHSGRTWLGDGVSPLGRVLSGGGNNGKDGTEGVHYKNVFGTYSHGPVLPKNPVFCDMILENALQRKYGDVKLPELDDTYENMAHDAAMEMVLGRRWKKKTAG